MRLISVIRWWFGLDRITSGTAVGIDVVEEEVLAGRGTTGGEEVCRSMLRICRRGLKVERARLFGPDRSVKVVART